VEGVLSVLGGGGEVTSDRAELSGAGEGAQTPGYFLSEFDHADVAFRAVVVWGDSPVGGEAQVVILALKEPAGQGVVFFHQFR